MSIPRLFLGHSGSGALYLLGSGVADGAAAFTPLLETAPIAPGGWGARCGFNRLYVPITWTMATTLRVIPIVEGVEKAPVDIELAEQPERKTDLFELALFEPFLGADGVTEVGRVALQGTWIQFRITTAGGLGPGVLFIHDPVLDFDVLEEDREASGGAAS